MAGVISLFIVLLIWRFFLILGEEVFAAAGLPRTAARFEARSALVGAGYTTSQSEHVVRDPTAQRVAAILVVFGYFGPAAVLALLGVSFVVPVGEDLTERTIALVVLVLGLVLVDRLGAIRALGSRPARALARRMTATGAVETWLVTGDRAIAAAVIPSEPARAERTIAVLTAPDVQVLSVEPSGPGPTTFPSQAFPSEMPSVELHPGERVVVFGPKRTLDDLRQAPR